jgi:hypothetical protein
MTGLTKQSDNGRLSGTSNYDGWTGHTGAGVPPGARLAHGIRYIERRHVVSAWLSQCAANRLPAPVQSTRPEGRRENINATRATIERALSHLDMPLREKSRTLAVPDGRAPARSSRWTSRTHIYAAPNPRAAISKGPLGLRHRTVNKRPRRFTNASGSPDPGHEDACPPVPQVNMRRHIHQGRGGIPRSAPGIVSSSRLPASAGTAVRQMVDCLRLNV